jgi:hypothetical protein
MWTPPRLWNHPSNGCKHWKFEQVSNYESGPKNLRLLEWEVEGGVDLGFRIEDFLLSNLVL